MLHRSLAAKGIDPGATGSVGFSDLGASPHRRNIEQLAATGIIEGRSDGTFRPSDPIRRDEMASVLVRLLERRYGHVPPVGPSFGDVDPGSVHAPNISQLVGAGGTQGVSAGRFDPSGRVTRAVDGHVRDARRRRARPIRSDRGAGDRPVRRVASARFGARRADLARVGAPSRWFLALRACSVTVGHDLGPLDRTLRRPPCCAAHGP
jgi:hypothetical protein